MTNAFLVPVEISPGELVDRLTELELKIERGLGAERPSVIHRRHEKLAAAYRSLTADFAGLTPLKAELKEINADRQALRDDMEAFERRADFGPAYVALARSILPTEDRRAELRLKIDQRLSGDVVAPSF